MARTTREIKSLHKPGRVSRKKAHSAARTIRVTTTSKKHGKGAGKTIVIKVDGTATGRHKVAFRAAKVSSKDNLSKSSRKPSKKRVSK